MKRILTTMCALTLLLAASVPALAVEPEQSASYYPTSVEEYMEGDSPRIKKVSACRKSPAKAGLFHLDEVK